MSEEPLPWYGGIWVILDYAWNPFFLGLCMLFTFLCALGLLTFFYLQWRCGSGGLPFLCGYWMLYVLFVSRFESTAEAVALACPVRTLYS